MLIGIDSMYTIQLITITSKVNTNNKPIKNFSDLVCFIISVIEI